MPLLHARLSICAGLLPRARARSSSGVVAAALDSCALCTVQQPGPCCCRCPNRHLIRDLPCTSCLRSRPVRCAIFVVMPSLDPKGPGTPLFQPRNLLPRFLLYREQRHSCQLAPTPSGAHASTRFVTAKSGGCPCIVGRRRTPPMHSGRVRTPACGGGPKSSAGRASWRSDSLPSIGDVFSRACARVCVCVCVCGCFCKGLNRSVYRRNLWSDTV